jgi:hypothetical protein
LNLHNISDVRQREVHTAEPLVSGPSLLEFGIANAKMKNYKSPCSDQTPAEISLLSASDKLTTFIWNKEELPD